MAEQDDILSLQDFMTFFAHGGRYGVPGEWPCHTILFYRLIGTDRCTSWKKTCRLHDEHAEVRMMKDEELQPSSVANGTSTLEMVLSFSPCKECSDKLITFKDNFKSLGKNLRITIKISSFYKTYEPPNMDGLVNLVKENVVLKIFDGDPDWTEFLRDVIGRSEEYFPAWLAVSRKKERREREYIDRCIQKDIYSYHRGDISIEDLHEMGCYPSNAREIKKDRKKNKDGDGVSRMRAQAIM